MATPDAGPNHATSPLGEGKKPDAAHSLEAWLLGLLGQRCPRCLKGHLFRSGLTMNDPCPVCGLLFQREEGYFLGAMYTSYVLASLLLGAFYFVASLLFPTWSSLAVAVVAMVPFLPLVPVLFRYSRALWIYFDRAVDPGDTAAGAYEKVRQRQQDEGTTRPPAP